MQDSIHSWILFFVYLIACGQAAWITSLWSGDLNRAPNGGLQAGVAIFAILTVSTKHAPAYNYSERTHIKSISIQELLVIIILLYIAHTINTACICTCVYTLL